MMVSVYWSPLTAGLTNMITGARTHQLIFIPSDGVLCTEWVSMLLKVSFTFSHALVIFAVWVGHPQSPRAVWHLCVPLDCCHFNVVCAWRKSVHLNWRIWGKNFLLSFCVVNFLSLVFFSLTQLLCLQHFATQPFFFPVLWWHAALRLTVGVQIFKRNEFLFISLGPSCDLKLILT